MRQVKPTHVTVVRYVMPDGTRARKGDPGAKKVKEKSEAYYARLQIDGKPVRVPLGTTDLGQAWEELRKLQRREKDRSAGIPVDLLDQASRPIEQHFDEWIAAVSHKGTSPDQLALMRARVQHLASVAGWRALPSITHDTCLKALAGLQPKLSAQTRNHYARHIKQFTRWCTRTRPRRLVEDPLELIDMINVETDRRHDRRVPTTAEIRKLFRHLETAPKRCKMTGPQRSLGYRVAMATGFRVSEMRSLTWKSFDLEAGTVIVRAGYSKHRRLDEQPLPKWLVAELKEWAANDGNLWATYPLSHPGRPLKEDVIRAGIEYVAEGPDGPLFFDYHALRHYFCTQIANQPGISPKTLMALTRHSTADLALRIYAKAKQKDKRAAVEKMPKPEK